MFLICHLLSFYKKSGISDLLLFLSQYLRQSKNDIKLIFQIRSTPVLGNKRFEFHISSEHQKEERYNGSDDCIRLYLNTVINLPSSGKLNQSTTVSSQCERFS